MKTNFTFYLKSSLMVLFLGLGLSSWGQVTVTSNFGAQNGNIGNDNTISYSSQQTNSSYWSPLRVYANTVFSVQSNNEAVITSISITYNNNNYYDVSNIYYVGENSSTTSQVSSSSIDGVTPTRIFTFVEEDNVKFFTFTSTAQIRLDSITVTYITANSCETSDIAFANTEETADLADGTFTQTATSLNQTTAITYTSSDEDVATVNPTTGEVTLVSVGTTTITATQALGEHNGETYCGATITYTLNVIDTTPSLTVSTNSLSFTGYEGGSFTTQDLTITGLNLTGDITLTLTGDTNFAINPTTLAATGGDVTITYTPSATPASHSATLTVANGAFSEVITLSGVTTVMPEVGCFEDSFDDILAGNSTGSTGSNSTWDGNDNFPTVVRAYQAGGVVRLGSSSNNGSITSVPLTEYAGHNVVVSFSSKAWGTNASSILISFGTQSQVVNLPAASNWTDGLSDYEVVFENIEPNATLTFETNSTSERRFFIDNVAVCLDVPSTDPALSVSESELTGFAYGLGSGPSASQSFVLSGENLDGSEDVTLLADTGFEISLDDTSFDNELVLTDYEGENTTIYVRLASGLALGAHSGVILINGYGAEEEVSISGSVLAVPVVTEASDLTAQVDVAYSYQIIASDEPFSYVISSEALPAGLSLDTETGFISGTPTVAGEFIFGVEATNNIGTSEEGVFILTVAKGVQTVDGLENVDAYLGDADITLPTITDQGFTLVYEVEPNAVASISGNTISFTGLGSIDFIAYTEDGDANYEDYTEVFTVTVTEEPAGPCLVETFDAGNPEWTMENVSYTESSGTASFNSQNGYLVTPELSFPNNLNFDLARTGNNNSKTFYVEISTVSPTEGFGSPIATYDHNNTTSGGTTSITVDLADYSSQSSVYIRFRKESSTTSPWRLDNIEVFCNEAPITTPITWTTEGVWSNITGPTISDDVVIEGDLTTANFSANTLTVNGTIVIASGDSVTVQGAIVNNGDFTVEAGGNLIQVDDVENTGAITVEVKAMTEWFGYNMFSSPVAGQAFTDFSSNNGNEVYTYDYANPDGWVSASGGFVEGEGYLFAAPYTGFPQGVLNPFFGEFVGVPHNGAVSVNVAENSFVSLGNPYPSAIDADELLVTNNNIGTLYFWTNTHFYDAVTSAYPGNNYATYTLVGGVGTGEQAEAGGNAFPTPNGAIQTGQGFIAGIATGGTITFDNTMRFATGGTFYKVMEEDKHRLWLSLADQNNELNQILVGYMEGASQGVDTGIDGPMFGYDGSALYSLIENSDTNYVIQGRYPFATADVVPLGFRAIEGGSYTISLANFDGLFADGQDIFLKDNATQTYHDLKAGAYTFVSEQGVFESRFEVVYQADGGLSTNNPTLDNKWIVYSQDNGFQIETQGFELKEVMVYDMLGRLVYNNPAEGTSHTISNIANGVLIVKVITTDNQVLTRKTAK